MKLTIKYKVLLSFVALSLLGAGCKKVDFGDTNIDPNRTTAPITSALLTNVLAGFGNNTWDQGGVRTVTGLYCQYFTETQYTEYSRYSDPKRDWDGFYAGALYDLQNIINYNSDPATAESAAVNGSNANQIAVARIMKAYYFWWLTDTYGDLPYLEALKANGTVPYDSQDQVYADLFKELREAVAQFDNGLPAAGDIVFNGDISKWKKFANSLRMLMALRLSKVDPATGKTEFTSALSDPAGSISDNSDNAQVVYPGGNFQNPFYNYYNVIKRDDYSVAKTLMDWINGHNDNRNQVFGTTTIGFPYGLTRDDAVTYANANTNYSRLMNTTVAGETSPIVVVGASNVLLARAEAANLGWTAEDYTALYNSALDQSWQQWGVFNASDIANYKANADVNLGSASGTVAQKIATQQWLAWYPNGVQGWSVWRKTGYPALVPAPGTTAIPRRVPYGPNEPQLNGANYAPAAAKYQDGSGANSAFVRLWWDMP